MQIVETRWSSYLLRSLLLRLDCNIHRERREEVGSYLSSPTLLLSTTHQQRTPTSPSWLPTPRNSSFRYIHLSLSQTFLMPCNGEARSRKISTELSKSFLYKFCKTDQVLYKFCRRMKFVYTLDIYTKLFSTHWLQNLLPHKCLRVHRV